jgi:hypothetical protein
MLQSCLKITKCNRIVEKLTVKKYVCLLWKQSSLTRSQKPATGHYLVHANKHMIFTHHLCLRLPSCFFLSGCMTKTYALLIPMRATCSAQPIFLNFIILTKFCEEYKSWSTSLRNILHLPVAGFGVHPASSPIVPEFFLWQVKLLRHEVNHSPQSRATLTVN